MPTRTTAWRAIGVTLFFALLSAVMLVPLTFHLNSWVPDAPFIPGRVSDYYHFHWDLWWLRYAALHGQNIWYTNKVLAPFTHNLAYHSLTASLLPVSLIFEPLVGPMRTANGIIWASVAATGALMAALLRRHRVGWTSALAGGVALAFSPYMLDHAASGHLNLLTVWWIPLVLMAWEQTGRTRQIRWAMLTGAILWGMWFTDTLIVLWGGLLLGPYALYALLRAASRQIRGRLVLLGTLALAITVVLAWFLGPIQPTLDFDQSQLPPARLLTLRYYSMPLRALFWPRPWSTIDVQKPDAETLGLWMVVLLVPALLIRRAGRERWFWLVVGLFVLILTLGPDVRVFGMRVPLPFRVIHELFHGQMRTPSRFLPPAMVGLILFLALSFDPWLRRLRARSARALVGAGVLLALLFDYGVFMPLPATPAPPSYNFYQMLRAEHYPDYDYVVLDVPTGPFTGWREVGSHPEAMFYAITHEKRIVSGLLSRIPINEHLFYEQSPLLGWLTDSHPLDTSPAASELNRIVDEWPLGYIVIHLGWLAPGRAPEILTFFNAQPSVCLVTVERDAVLYRTISHPKGCPPRTPPQTAPGDYTIPFGELSDAGFIGSGWYDRENIGGESARWTGNRSLETLIYADVPPDGAYTLTLRAVAFEQPRSIQVTVGRVVDGELITGQFGPLTIVPGDWGEYSLTLPADLITRLDGKMVIPLAADGADSAADLNLSSDTRPLSAAYDWIRFRREP